MTKINKILFLAYFYPPLGGSASLRAAKLASYLPEFGIVPIILAAKGARYPIREANVPDLTTIYAPTLQLPPLPRWLKRINSKGGKNDDRRIGPSMSLENSLGKLLDFFLLPDSRVGWLPGCVRAGVRAVRHFKPQAILSTAPPNTSHLAATIIARRTGIPLILDYRDAWSQNPFRHPPTPFHNTLNKWLEKWCGHNAKAVVGVTAPMVKDLQAILGEKLIYRHIPNGYDEKDFTDQLQPPTNGPLLIVYAGTFYGTRQPTTFFRALDELITEGLIGIGQIKVILLGNHPSLIRHLAPPNVEPFLVWRGVQSHAEAVHAMATAHVNWLVIGTGSGAETTATGKLYEYLRAPGQILAQVPVGVAADIIREHDAGIIIDPQDVEGAKAAVIELLKEHEAGRLLKPRLGNITRYERREIAGQMAELIQVVIKERK